MAWRWVPDKELTEDSPAARSFPTQGEAETWLGEFYPQLMDSGVQTVSLYEEDRLVYGPMNLVPDHD